MKKPPKVVPITDSKPEWIAADELARRFILRIGQQRVAFDFLTRVTNLPSGTGDMPADVVPIKSKRKPKGGDSLG
jgi:hypothetical protein